MPEPVEPTDVSVDPSRARSLRRLRPADLHESLESQEARAADLRRELDELRRSLQAVPALPPAPRPPRRGRRLAVAGAGAVLVLGTGAVAAAHVAQRDPAAPPARTPAPTPSAPPATAVDGPAPSPAPSPTPSVVASPSPSPSASVQAGPPLAAWPGRAVPQPPDLPTTGPGADRPGTEVTAMIDADRSHVDVYERALLAPGADLTLRPAASAVVDRALAAAPPVVDGLTAEVDGRPVPVRRSGTGWALAAPQPAPTASTRVAVVLRYRLSGALVRREPSPPGRYTLVMTPLAPSAGHGAADAVAVRVRDPRVEEVYCPGAKDQLAQLCGRDDGPLHVAVVPAGADPVVIALVTFPT